MKIELIIFFHQLMHHPLDKYNQLKNFQKVFLIIKKYYSFLLTFN